MNKRSFEQVRVEEVQDEPPPKPSALPDEQIELVRRVAEILRTYGRFDRGRDTVVDQIY